MNNHSKRLINQMFKLISNYTEGKTDKYILLDNLSGNCGAIEEKEIQKVAEKNVDDIELALWTYDEKDGIEIIKSKIIRLEEMINS